MHQRRNSTAVRFAQAQFACAMSCCPTNNRIMLIAADIMIMMSVFASLLLGLLWPYKRLLHAAVL